VAHEPRPFRHLSTMRRLVPQQPGGSAEIALGPAVEIRDSGQSSFFSSLTVCLSTGRGRFRNATKGGGERPSQNNQTNTAVKWETPISTNEYPSPSGGRCPKGGRGRSRPKVSSPTCGGGVAKRRRWEPPSQNHQTNEAVKWGTHYSTNEYPGWWPRPFRPTNALPPPGEEPAPDSIRGARSAEEGQPSSFDRLRTRCFSGARHGIILPHI
jgi:hypothetical protein